MNTENIREHQLEEVPSRPNGDPRLVSKASGWGAGRLHFFKYINLKEP